MSGKEITTKAIDGSGPGIIVIQEIFSVNDIMQGITGSFAKAGYMAFRRGGRLAYLTAARIKADAARQRSLGNFRVHLG